ncbi:MAG: hypothetical protein ACOX1P_03730 [Thermoguttaceae bacterium]|jgi:hypothetical protein
MHNLRNMSDFNVFVNPPEGRPLDLSAWRQKTGCEMHSATCASRMELSPSNWTLRQDQPFPDLQIPRVSAMTLDFFGAARGSGATTGAGPFIKQALKAEITLWKGLPR